MAIEGIKSSVMSPMTKVETPASVERVEVAASTQTTTDRPVTETQGSEYRGSDRENPDGRNDEKNLQDVSPEKVKNAISEINQKIRPTHTQCEFKYHEETNRISITVRDTDTDEVIREIPPEKTLDMIAKTLELAGLLVDEKR